MEKKIKQRLQTFFKSLKESFEDWKKCQTRTKTCIEKLDNLNDQYQCCVQASVESLISIFPHVKERLLHKLYIAIEEEVTKLREEIVTLEEASSQLNRQSDNIMFIYRSNKTKLPISTITERSPICPSIAEMLEWSQNSSALLRQQALYKKFVVEEWNPGHPESLVTMVTSWTSSDDDVMESLQCYLSYTSIFLEEDLT